MKVNVPVASTPRPKTHEGAPAQRLTPKAQLRRTVMACMLWEKQFYESGVAIADRIADLVKQCSSADVSKMAIEAREQMKLRHVPLLLCRELARHGKLKADTLARVIQRPDELSEFLAIYWKDGRCSMSAQVKKGLAKAFTKFNAYSLAKYNRDGVIKLRDVLFMCHAKPSDDEQAALWKQLVDNTLTPPDTWEVALSSGADKKAAWERLLKENKLGALALLRNLRNMEQVGIDDKLIGGALSRMDTSRVLPFRFLTAAKHAIRFEPQLEQAMFKCLSQRRKLSGKTIMIVDVSGSMYGIPVSEKSEMDRAHAACALALLVREVCEDPRIYATAGNDITRIHDTKAVPPRRGFALSDAIHGMCHPLGGGGIFLKQVIEYVKEKEKHADRIIVITDEQDCDTEANSPLKATPFGRENYLINVSGDKHGIGYGKWTHIDGWSEAILDYIGDSELQLDSHSNRQL